MTRTTQVYAAGRDLKSQSQSLEFKLRVMRLSRAVLTALFLLPSHLQVGKDRLLHAVTGRAVDSTELQRRRHGHGPSQPHRAAEFGSHITSRRRPSRDRCPELEVEVEGGRPPQLAPGNLTRKAGRRRRSRAGETSANPVHPSQQT